MCLPVCYSSSVSNFKLRFPSLDINLSLFLFALPLYDLISIRYGSSLTLLFDNCQEMRNSFPILIPFLILLVPAESGAAQYNKMTILVLYSFFYLFGHQQGVKINSMRTHRTNHQPSNRSSCYATNFQLKSIHFLFQSSNGTK